MRKIIGSLLVVTSIACLTGCGAKNKGENFEFELYSNSSTGYKWEYAFTKNDIVEVKKDYKSDCGDDMVDGCGGKDIFKIIPKKAGKTKMNLKYCSFSWNDCSKDVTYEFTVSDDLKITEKHSGSYYEKD